MNFAHSLGGPGIPLGNQTRQRREETKGRTGPRGNAPQALGKVAEAFRCLSCQSFWPTGFKQVVGFGFVSDSRAGACDYSTAF